MSTTSFISIKLFPRTIKYCYVPIKESKFVPRTENLKLCSSSAVFKPNANNVVSRLNFVNRSYSHFYQEKVSFRREFALTISPIIIQRRNFSLKETYESTLSTQISVFKWLSESTGVKYAQDFIIYLHDSSGLPWWLTIILTTCLVRSVVIFPIAFYQNYVIARFENVREELKNIVNDITYDLNREVRKNKWPEKKARMHLRLAVRKEYTRLIERDNCHPAKASILAVVQIPTWIIMSTAFRNLVYRLPHDDTAAHLTCLEMSLGGVAWFPNLTLPDSFILPIMLGLTNLAIVEVQAMLHKGERKRLHRYITNFFRGFSIVMIPVAATVPSCLTLYWLTSSTFGLCQNLLIISPRVRRMFGIPATPSTHSHPYSYLADQIRNKFRISK